MQPILKFREVRCRVHSELIFYAQVVNADKLSDEMKALQKERIRANRQSAASLSAAYIELPGWYRWWLEQMGRRPQEAVRHLIGYSNTHEYDEGHRREEEIKKALNLPREI